MSQQRASALVVSWSFERALAYVRAMGATREDETELATIIAEGGCVDFDLPEDSPTFPELWGSTRDRGSRVTSIDETRPPTTD